MGPKRGRPSGKNDHEPTSGKKKVKEEVDYTLYQDIANWIRIDEVRAVHVTKSGHPTSGASIADILSVLFFH
jgi:transketolase N-terminal domain/subunit